MHRILKTEGERHHSEGHIRRTSDLPESSIAVSDTVFCAVGEAGSGNTFLQREGEEEGNC